MSNLHPNFLPIWCPHCQGTPDRGVQEIQLDQVAVGSAGAATLYRVLAVYSGACAVRLNFIHTRERVLVLLLLYR